MSITAEQKTHVINLLKKKYVDWDGFDHQAFRRDQINYKRSAVKKAVSLLSESKLAQLLVTRDTEAFIERLERVGKANKLLKSTDASNGDLEILYVPTLDKPVFCAQVYHLLHGTEPVVERLASYLDYIEAHELPNTWSFPTYLLQFCYPGTEFLVLPKPTEWFLKYIGLSPTLGKPTPDTYSAIREFAHSLKYAMASYRPQDMIDIQSAIQVCSAMSDPAHHALNGLDDIEQAEQAVFEDPFRATADVGDGSWPQSGSYESDATMLHISDVSDESHTEINLPPEGATFPAALQATDSSGEGSLLPDQFKKFITEYMVSPAGVARAAAYAKAREQAEQNFAHLIAEHELGETVTDRVFLHLLPHADTPENQSKGAWIHPIHEAAERLLERLEIQFSSQQDVREQVGQVLLEFTRHCVYKSNALDRSSEALARLDSLSLMDISSITPILHALKPTQYMLLHQEAIEMLQAYGGAGNSTNLTVLPELNQTGLNFIRHLRNETQTDAIPSVHDTDLFDIFVHWRQENGRTTSAKNSEPGAPAHTNGSATAQAPEPIEAQPITAAPPYESDYRRNEERERASETIKAILEPVDSTVNSSYSLEDCSKETGFEISTLQQWLNTLERKRQIIFYGPSGTGKTFMAQQLAR
ncbi:MAG: hypothetical protein AAF564_24850, partial [Bacteroidota bacterium]